MFCALRLFVDTCEIFTVARYKELVTSRSRKFLTIREITFRQFVFREPHVGELCARFQIYFVSDADGSLKAIDQRLAESLHALLVELASAD